ncbi:uncharacterized protein LOC102720034 [Oryza brachyantha]|uniref:Uncharacterized protein n=1 Tax=Oryza brachyantha TaxID=4533 RepID=J3LM03_ORYBR|nr:uncharacterized protein LOC102720034 [Oryza brachyantha]
MLNSTVKLIALWASPSSPSLLAFCVSHLIVALLLLAGRSAAPEISGRAVGGRSLEAGAGVPRKETNPGGREARLPAVDAGGRGGCAPGVDGRAEECLVRVGDGDAVEMQARERGSSAREEELVAAHALREKNCDDGEDELMLRAEEFIRRMNRIWMAENLRVC